MLEWLTQITLRLTDPVFGWLLAVPRDVALFIVALSTAVILTVVRKFTTDQEHLKHCDQDKARLKALVKDAKSKKDKDALQRHRAVERMMASRAMSHEWKPLIVSLIPIAFLGTWCFLRLDYVPPRAGEPIEIAAYFPVSAAAAGQTVHMVPQPGLRSENGWVQSVEAQKLTAKEIEKGVTPNGVAVWRLKGDARPAPYPLQIRSGGRTYTRPLLVGQRTYEESFTLFAPDSPVVGIEARMKQIKLFGVVPGIPFLMLPPWLFAYFLIAIPLSMLLKPMLHIY